MVDELLSSEEEDDESWFDFSRGDSGCSALAKEGLVVDDGSGELCKQAETSGRWADRVELEDGEILPDIPVVPIFGKEEAINQWALTKWE